jgi:hypothetical protein
LGAAHFFPPRPQSEGGMSEAPRPLLRELIDIPERVYQGDFVVRLAEGVSDAQAAETVKSYVVTPQLANAFDAALGFIQRAVESRRSAACYLHGSFGAGKSHFMAVLDLLLAGNTLARAIPELAATLNRHHDWMNGKRFLMVPFHMIGARDVESAILGGYAEYVRRLHPTAPTPGFYLGENLFADARNLRGQIGDDAFFTRFNDGLDGDWNAPWDAPSFEAATLEPPEGEERQRLVGDLITRFFAGYRDVAMARGEAFVSLDTGLAILSQHARNLSFDAVILFLDELILWLATRAADVDFVSTEGSKLSKLVEAQRADRPIPIISFIARQRDLRELIGEHHAGALQLSFLDTLRYWERAFELVTLEDRNLPVIAERRLLQPVNEAARQQMGDAFDEFAQRRRDVLETLLGSDGERELFRKVYPFSPALVQALIAASSALQRERTALKLMLTLLVERRDEFRLGSLIPVGDLWDAIAAGDQPFSEGMRIEFDNAKKLWSQKLLPLLERTHSVSWQDLQNGHADPRAAANLRNDARLLKTLLLAALVPEVPALRGLTASRLAALNHGSVVSPVPGRENATVLQKLRGWAAQVGEVRFSDDPINPIISVQISGVDVEPILENAKIFDNDGNRRSKVRKTLFDALGVAAEDGLLGGQGFVEHAYLWRGTRRPVDVYFEAVEELSADRLRGREGAPTVVFGMPFDFRGRLPADHRAHLDRFGDEDGAGGVVWLTSYFSDRALRDLGTLVRIDFLLAGAGDRFDDAGRHLSAIEREQARAVLRNQQSALQQRLRICLECAYGIRPDQDGCLGTVVAAEDHLVPLDGTFRPQPPVGATLKDAFEALLDRVFEHRFPAHPLFEQELRIPVLRQVLEQVQKAAAEPQQRLHVDNSSVRRILAGIAGPLKLGTMGQTPFVLSSDWADHFARMHARAGGGPITVAQLLGWIDEPKPMGLTPEAQNLVILAFAAQADRTLLRHGAPVVASIDRLDDQIELREQPLPDEAVWARARDRAASLFGLPSNEVRKGANVAQLATDLKDQTTAKRPILTELANTLRGRMEWFGVAIDAAPRVVTIRSASALIGDLATAADALSMINVLANAELLTSAAAVSRSLGSAAALRSYLASVQWEAIEAAASLRDHRAAAAEALRTRVAEALAADEHVMSLQSALQEAQSRAIRLLADTGRPPSPEPRLEQRPPSLPPGEVVVEERPFGPIVATEAVPLLDELRRRILAEHGATLTIGWRLTRPAGGASE